MINSNKQSPKALYELDAMPKNKYIVLKVFFLNALPRALSLSSLIIIDFYEHMRTRRNNIYEYFIFSYCSSEYLKYITYKK